MKKNVTNDKKVRSEVDATSLRLAKIFWSQVWRAIIIVGIIGSVLIPLGFLLQAFFAIKYNFTDLEQFNREQGFVFSLTLLPFLYLLQYILFRMVIGIKYSDFSLNFSPKRDRNSPDYSPLICKVTWAYLWRTVPLNYILNPGIPYLFPTLKGSILYTNLEIVLNILIGIFFLKFVLNKQYDNVRLSLLSLKKNRED